MEILTDLQRSLLDYRRSLYRPTPQQTVVEWSEANLRLTQRQTEHPDDDHRRPQDNPQQFALALDP